MFVTVDTRMGSQLDGRAAPMLIKPVDMFQFQRLVQRLEHNGEEGAAAHI